jgi:WD40 repeat protein/nucleoside phosphorylase
MADGNRHVDVCIVCAKADEAQAVVQEFSSRCRVSYKQDFIVSDNNYKYEYNYMEIKNEKKEALTVLVTSLAYQGPVQTASFVTFLLNTFHPRFAAMTGYCAGDKTELSLGDLVVAEAAYHYEEGKVKEVEDGQKLHVPLIRPKEPAINIIQYVNRFNAWKKPVGEIKPPEIEDSLADPNQVKCLIGYIASGMAVRRDNPFEELRSHNHKTVALEMEAAAFYEAASSFSDIYSLVVKGVCDYADMNKHDKYHEYAARVSATYLLYFIQEYVTNTTMPRRDDQWTRRQLLAGLAGLVITGSGIAWFALSQRSKALPYTTPVPLGTVLYTYRRHSDWVIAVTWSPDSNRIASASADKTVQVWNVTDGGQVYIYRGHSDFVYAVAWSPDGRRIASGSGDGTVQVWDAVNGERLFTYSGHIKAEFGVQSVAWSPDGTRIASGGSDGTVHVWYALDGGQVFTYNGHANGVNALAWSPFDGKYIAFGSSDNTVQVWDATDGKLVSTYRGHSKQVLAVAWSPDGKRIASGSEDNTMQVWDAADNQLICSCRGHKYWVAGVTWSPDGKRIASGSWDTTVRVWNPVNARQLYIYTGHSDPVNSVRWSPNGALIASGSGLPARGVVQVWGAG